MSGIKYSGWTGSDEFPRLHVTFIDKDGDEHKFEVSEGDNLLDIAQANELEMEGTSCYTKTQTML